MKIRTSTPSDFVILPEVMGVIVYAALLRVWSVYALATFYAPTVESGGRRMISSPMFFGLSLVNLGLLGLLYKAYGRTKDDGPSVKLAHTVGLAVAAILVVLVQVGVFQAHDLWVANDR
ncbi:MAG: hypothetical protein KDB61_01105 [Planctomycetes bacterium]|nr:hypothetical protein [Planctomycetota bacterium]